MKRCISIVVCALFAAALLAGCGGKTEGEADHPKVAQDAGTAAGDPGAAAGDLVNKAPDAVSPYKAKWNSTIAFLEKGLEPIREAAGSAKSPELDALIGKIGTGLQDSKSMLAGLGEESGEALDGQKKAFESKVGEVKGMLASADSMLKELVPGYKKLPGGN